MRRGYPRTATPAKPHKVDFQNRLDRDILRAALLCRSTKGISIAADCTHHQVSYCLRKAGLRRTDLRDGVGRWAATLERNLGPVLDAALNKTSNVVLRATGKLE